MRSLPFLDNGGGRVTFSAILRFPETYRTPFVGITRGLLWHMHDGAFRARRWHLVIIMPLGRFCEDVSRNTKDRRA